MAREHAMIEPFEEDQVRDGVISYGLSSYGYDIRVADEFRIFTNVFTATVDPKNFDEECLVEPPLRTAEDGSQYYLMPPHSYALGVTVETFRMPRRVTGIAMGKCLTKDARIVDAATGDLISIADFGADGRVLAYAEGRLGGQEALSVVNQGRKRVFTVKTRLGHKITATGNHPFLTVGGWRELRDLGVGSRIAAARRLSGQE
jgi:deoxycytidine triphosphate deaminase